MNACPGTACPHYIGQGCRCPTDDGPPIRAQITEPDDYARLERASRPRDEADQRIPGVLPPGYAGITETEQQ